MRNEIKMKTESRTHGWRKERTFGWRIVQPLSSLLSTRRHRWLALLLVISLLGCVSKSNSRSQAETAYNRGQQSVVAEQPLEPPVIFFKGDVRNQRIPWTEGLTLAQALLAAQYTWSWDPRRITVTRGDQTFAVNPRRLLRGEEDPLLERGDVVEVRH
jgi:hypothetical protein